MSAFYAFILALGTIVCSISAYGQAAGMQGQCSTDSRRLLSDSYVDAALTEILTPPRWQESVVSISIETDYWSRVIVREAGGTFELLQGSVRKDLHGFLAGLAEKCELPYNPLELRDRVKADWVRAEISADTFRRVHRQFTSAAAQQVNNARARYNERVKSRVTVVRVHVHEYLIVYDNSFEHIQTKVEDAKNESGEMDPVLAWVHNILELRDKAFAK